MSRDPSSPLPTVGVIGGGTAGYFAALALKRRFPEMRVSLVESKRIPIIGVGEATTTSMPSFLHGQLGLDVVALFREVQPTFKLGIRFEWGPSEPDHFNFPFGDAHPVSAQACDGTLSHQSLGSVLMDRGALPILEEPDGSLRPLFDTCKVAYHLDNAPFVAFLRRAADERGIEHIDATVVDAELSAKGDVGAVLLDSGDRLHRDLFIDASGFRSLLLERKLGATFLSYADSLFCDRAIVAGVPRAEHAPVQPYTTAETMQAGWCWRIPVGHEDHRGYVCSSAFVSEEAALAEMRARNPTMGEPRTVHFRSGRHDRFWIGNVVGLGNAYAFVEPLESTGLHMVIVQINRLLTGLAAMLQGRPAEAVRAEANDALAAHWDSLRWFLAAHYRFNGRLDTPFWRAARSSANVSGLADVLARYADEGPKIEVERGRAVGLDAIFGIAGLVPLLLGQQVPSGPLSSRFAPAEWRERIASQTVLAARALTQRDALRGALSSEPILRSLERAASRWANDDRTLLTK